MQSDPDRVPNRRGGSAAIRAISLRGQGKVKNGCVFLDSLGVTDWAEAGPPRSRHQRRQICAADFPYCFPQLRIASHTGW